MVICAHCRKDFSFFLLDAKHALVRASGSAALSGLIYICFPSKINGENRYLSCTFLSVINLV